MRKPDPTEIASDDQGEYLIFIGKTCTVPGCGLQLTSRNRFHKRTFCMDHGKELDRQRQRMKYAERAAGGGALKTQDTLPEDDPVLDHVPEVQDTKPQAPQQPAKEFNRRNYIPDELWLHVPRVRGALTFWLAHPMNKNAFENLQRLIRDYELRARLIRASAPQ